MLILVSHDYAVLTFALLTTYWVLLLFASGTSAEEVRLIQMFSYHKLFLRSSIPGKVLTTEFWGKYYTSFHVPPYMTIQKTHQ